MADEGTTTGLEPRTAAALAYLAGPFSGALMLWVERENTFIRFHACQSVIGLGGLALALLGSYLLAAIAMFVSASLVTVLFNVAAVIWIVLVITTVLCAWKAWSGERWRLPLVADYADRFLARRV
jgi:uncharacterized membrane protein